MNTIVLSGLVKRPASPSSRRTASITSGRYSPMEGGNVRFPWRAGTDPTTRSTPPLCGRKRSSEFLPKNIAAGPI
jgi:hypothetical protein